MALTIIAPLSLLPEDISSIRFVGFLGAICMVYIAFTVVLGDGLRALENGGLCSLSPVASEPELSTLTSGWVTLLQNAPIFLMTMNASVAYVPVRFQHQTCWGHLLSSMAERSRLSSALIVPRKESSILVWTIIAVAGGLYLVVSWTAFAAYCETVPENIVDTWPLAWIPGSLARLFLMVDLVAGAAGIYIPLGRAALLQLLLGPCESLLGRVTIPVMRAISTLCLVAGGAIGSVLLGGAVALPLVITSALCVTAHVFFSARPLCPCPPGGLEEQQPYSMQKAHGDRVCGCGDRWWAGCPGPRGPVGNVWMTRNASLAGPGTA